MKSFLIITALAALLGVVAGASFAQDRYLTLEGTVGRYPVVLQLKCADTECYSSSYFYLDKCQDIFLQGTRSNGHLNLTGQNERFELEEREDHLISGTWTNGKGAKLDVRLHPINVHNVQSPYDHLLFLDTLKRERPADYLRISRLRFMRDSVTSLQRQEFVWLHEYHSGVSFFRLGNGFSKDLRERINPILDRIHIEYALERLSCTSPYGGATIDYNTAITFLSSDLLGFNVAAFYDCGGAHPDWGNEGFLLDLNSGGRYTIDDILSFDKSVVVSTDDNFDAFSAYREAFFAPRIMELERQEHSFAVPASEDDCNYLDPEIWNFPTWTVTESGIAFTPSVPHVMAPCREPFLIPFTKLAAYKHPQFPYNFPGWK